MTQFKKMKVRINNPDHSKSVQEWLFEQGYHWAFPSEILDVPNMEYIILGEDLADDKRLTYGTNVKLFNSREEPELNLRYLDPHFYSAHKSTCVPAKSYTEKPKVESHVIKSEFEKLSQQLKNLDKAIDSHENKQNKRKLDRQRVIEKMEGMTLGYRLVREGDVEPEDEPEFDPNEIVEGSVWECVTEDHSMRGLQVLIEGEGVFP